MKKKIKLVDVAVTSFITSEADSQIMGGALTHPVCVNSVKNCQSVADTECLQTMYSCYAYISCNVAACTTTVAGQYCNNTTTAVVVDPRTLDCI